MTKLSMRAQDALRRLQTIREQLPECPSTKRAETKILETLSLNEIAEVAQALKTWEATNDSI